MIDILFLWQDVGNQGPSALFWPFMLMGLFIFYFFMIRPQQKEAQQQKVFSEGLRKGSKVVTIGGLHGTISDLKDTQVSILIAPKTVVTLQRSSISLELTQSVYGSSITNSKEPAKEKV